MSIFDNNNNNAKVGYANLMFSMILKDSVDYLHNIKSFAESNIAQTLKDEFFVFGFRYENDSFYFTIEKDNVVEVNFSFDTINEDSLQVCLNKITEYVLNQ